MEVLKWFRSWDIIHTYIHTYILLQNMQQTVCWVLNETTTSAISPTSDLWVVWWIMQYFTLLPMFVGTNYFFFTGLTLTLLGLMCRISYGQHNLNATPFKEGKALWSNMLVHTVFIILFMNYIDLSLLWFH